MLRLASSILLGLHISKEPAALAALSSYKLQPASYKTAVNKVSVNNTQNILVTYTTLMLCAVMHTFPWLCVVAGGSFKGVSVVCVMVASLSIKRY